MIVGDTGHDGTRRGGDSPWPLTIAFLERHGISAHSVAIEGIDHSGYWTFVVDATGRRTIKPNGDYAMEHHEWPQTGAQYKHSRFPFHLTFGEMVGQLMHDDREAYGIANPVKAQVIDPDTGEPFTMDKLVLLARQYDFDRASLSDTGLVLWGKAIQNMTQRERETYDALYRRVSGTTETSNAGEGATT